MRTCFCVSADFGMVPPILWSPTNPYPNSRLNWCIYNVIDCFFFSAGVSIICRFAEDFAEFICFYPLGSILSGFSLHYLFGVAAFIGKFIWCQIQTYLIGILFIIQIFPFPVRFLLFAHIVHSRAGLISFSGVCLLLGV